MRLPALAGLLALLAAGAPAPALAQDKPGQFDFYVLALSWSPTYCATAKASPQQCGGSASHTFVVHGLWPQYERGYPDNCVRPAPYVPDKTISGITDLMPSKGLVLHEWRKHGTCTGLAPDAYFALVRQARARITVPPAFLKDAPAAMTADQIETAFTQANPGLAPDMMAVRCEKGTFSEIRICLGKDMAFRPCPDVERASCRGSRPLAVPAPR